MEATPSTIPLPDIPPLKDYTAADFVIGLLITIGASVLNAAGLNITKLDHVRNLQLPRAERKADWKRALWWLGLMLYIISQLVGSTLALEYLRAEYVAPLGASSLIFNFLFARFLVGTKITRRDILGTLVVVAGVIGVVAFGNARNPPKFADSDVDDADNDSGDHEDDGTIVVGDTETNMNLETLKKLWGAPSWIFYFLMYSIIVAGLFWFSILIDDVVREREEIESEMHAEQDRLFSNALGHNDNQDSLPTSLRNSSDNRAQDTSVFKYLLSKIVAAERNVKSYVKAVVENLTVSRPDSFVRKLSGISWSITGGLLAGMTLILAKSAVKLASTALSHSSDEHQFAHPLSILILIFLAVTGVTQVVCLNKGLKSYDSVLIVPLFFALYSASGFINSLTYLGEMELYSKAIFACIWISIIVLTAGVVILSSKPPERRPRSNSKVDVEAAEFEVSALGQPEEGTVNINTPSPQPESQHRDKDKDKEENIELSPLHSKSRNSEDDEEFGEFEEEGTILIDKTKGNEKAEMSEDTEQWTLGEGSDDDEK